MREGIGAFGVSGTSAGLLCTDRLQMLVLTTTSPRHCK